MKPRIRSHFLSPGVLVLAIVASPGHVLAQAPAGPLPAAQPLPAPGAGAQPQPAKAETRTSIIGQWKLNRDDSDDPRKKLEDARTSRGSGPRGGSGVSIAGFPIGGHGGNRGGANNEELGKTQDAIAPAISLTLAQKDAKNPEVDLTDDQNRKRALFTDGRKVQKPDAKDDSYEEIAARWDGSRLVTDEKSPHGGKLSRTFELSYDGTQLFETIRLTVGRSNAPLDVRYVYDPVVPRAAASNP